MPYFPIAYYTLADAYEIHSLEDVRLFQLPDDADESWPETPDGLGIKQLYFPHAKLFVGQHAHKFSHAHLVGNGELRVWVENVELGDFKAGEVITIEAGKRHTLMSLVRETRGFCISNIRDNPIVLRSEFPY